MQLNEFFKSEYIHVLSIQIKKQNIILQLTCQRLSLQHATQATISQYFILFADVFYFGGGSFCCSELAKPQPVPATS